MARIRIAPVVAMPITAANDSRPEALSGEPQAGIPEGACGQTAVSKVLPDYQCKTKSSALDNTQGGREQQGMGHWIQIFRTKKLCPQPVQA